MNKRKNRGGSMRPQRTRPIQPEGVYGNAHFMHAATSQVGSVVRIQTASGNVWEGVFRTFSSKFDVVIEVAAKVENPDSPNCSLIADSYVDKLIFKSCDIISMVARDVDLEFATRDTFQTDTAISARLNGQHRSEERELEPWDPSGVNGGDATLELDGNANGWDANDMFRKNEQIYGVTSTFDNSLSGYTVQLQPSDTPDYREAEAKAEQIANEIENHPAYKARIELENGDEEAMYAAVERPNQSQQDSNGKYIPPAKRKNQNAGKLMRSTPPPSQNSSAQTTLPYPNPNAPHNVHQPPHIIHNPPSVPGHGRPHSHTPPHSFSNPSIPRQQAPPQNAPQMNGDAKTVPQRPPRNMYQGGCNPPNVPPPAYQEPQLPKAEQINCVQSRSREETVKQFHKFAQDFKLCPQQSETIPAQMPHEQLPPQPPKQHTVQQTPPPQQPQQQQQPQQAISPQQQQQQQQENIDKVTNTLKKSTLNPNAKEFVLNPAAKPFTPRSPSTPTASRPHTPQTPSHNSYMPSATVSGPSSQPPPPMPVMVPMSYMMTSQHQYPAQPQGNRLRKIPMGQMRADVASQMQVAAATGQPLLAPAPLQQYVYPPSINPQGYPQMHAVKMMYDAPHQLQYLPQNHSNTSSPAQPPYTPGQGPQPPPQQYQGPPPQGHPQFPIMCPIIPAQQHMMQAAGMPYLQQPPPPQAAPIQVLLPPQAQQHGPAP